MIKIALPDSQYPDKYADCSNSELESLMVSLVRRGWSWEIDYSAADEAEKKKWEDLDMCYKICLALRESYVLCNGERFGEYNEQVFEKFLAAIDENKLFSIKIFDDKHVEMIMEEYVFH